MSSAREILTGPMSEARRLLPTLNWDENVCTLMLAIGLQESKLVFRRQMGNGPARGIFQFEKGNASSRGGVTGVMMHNATTGLLKHVADERGIPWSADAIWAALETDDVLACAVARLMLWTDPKKIPVRCDADGGWDAYLRIWRPGKPHPEFWGANHATAESAVIAQEM
jgi:hypothetical protein